MQARLDGPDRDAQGRRDVGQRQPEVVVQDDDRAARLVEPPEDVVDELAIGDARRSRPAAPGAWSGRELDLDDAGVGDGAPGRCRR